MPDNATREREYQSAQKPELAFEPDPPARGCHPRRESGAFVPHVAVRGQRHHRGQQCQRHGEPCQLGSHRRFGESGRSNHPRERERDGVATLSVTDRRGTKTAKITVTPPLSVSPGSASLLVGRSTTLIVSNAIGSIPVANSNSTAVGTSRSGNTITVTGRSEGSGRLPCAIANDRKGAGERHLSTSGFIERIHPGRLLASNCFQCHGTNGSGGFDELRGKNKAELLDELRGFASGREDAGGIMAAHATGYTDEQLQLIADFLSQQ